MSACDDLARSDLGQCVSQHRPIADLPERNTPGNAVIAGRRRALQARQVGIGEPLARTGHSTRFHAQFGGVEIPCFRRRPHKQLAGGGARPPNHRYRRRRRPTACGRAIVRRFGRVRQHHPQCVWGNAELFGRRLDDFGSGTLSKLHLASQHGDRSVRPQVQPLRRPDLSRGSSGAEDYLPRGRDEQAGTDRGDPLPAIQLETVGGTLGELLAVRLAEIFAESLRHRSPPSAGQRVPPTPRCCDSRSSGTGADSSRPRSPPCWALDSA